SVRDGMMRAGTSPSGYDGERQAVAARAGSAQLAVEGRDLGPAARARMFGHGLGEVARTVAAAAAAEGDGDVAARARLHRRQPGVEELRHLLHGLADLVALLQIGADLGVSPRQRLEP